MLRLLSPFVAQTFRAVEARPNREDLQVLARMIDDGKL
jgi:hypothetical protein